MGKSLGIVIIGNEILSGKTADANGPFLCRGLHRVGRMVTRIATIPDDLDTIAETVRDFSERFDDVITTGGVGPTHDDITCEGIARGFGVDVVRHRELETLARDYFGDKISEPLLRLCDVPDGTDLVPLAGLPWPALRMKNVFILPGIPSILQAKFEVLREHFRTDPIHLIQIYLDVREDRIAGLLEDIDAAYPSVDIGCYPVLDGDDYDTIVTLESRDLGAVEQATSHFRSKVPEASIVRTVDGAAESR